MPTADELRELEQISRLTGVAGGAGGGVHLVGPARGVVLPITDAAAMVGVATMIEHRKLKAADKVAELTAFAGRLHDLLSVDRPVMWLDVTPREQEIATFLLAQSRARTGLRSRIRSECKTCGFQTLTNPEEVKLQKHRKRVTSVAQGVGIAVFTGGVSPVLMASSLLGFMKLNPDFDCPKCHGLDADESIVVFCPRCKALHAEGVLKTCRCGHNFLAGVEGIVWLPTSEMVLPPKPAALQRTSAAAAGAHVRALVAVPGTRRFVSVTQHKTGPGSARLCVWEAGDPGSGSPPQPVCGGPTDIPTKVISVAVTSDGSIAALGTTGQVVLVRTSDGGTLVRLDAPWPFALAFSPDANLLVATGSEPYAWDRQGNRYSLGRLVAKKGSYIAFQPGGAHFALAGGTEVSVRRTADGVEVSHLAIGSPALGLAWTADGTGLIVPTSPATGGRITVHGAFDGWERAVFELHAAVYPDHVAVSPGAGLLAALCVGDTLRVLAADTGREILRENASNLYTDMAFLDDGRLVLARNEPTTPEAAVEVWTLHVDAGAPPAAAAPATRAPAW